MAAVKINITNDYKNKRRMLSYLTKNKKWGVYNRGYLFWYDVTKLDFVYEVFTSYMKSSRVANSG